MSAITTIAQREIDALGDTAQGILDNRHLSLEEAATRLVLKISATIDILKAIIEIDKQR